MYECNVILVFNIKGQSVVRKYFGAIIFILLLKKFHILCLFNAHQEGVKHPMHIGIGELAH